MKILKPSTGFLGLPKENKSKNIVHIIPFGLEKTVSYSSGTKNGPKKIIKASHQVELFDEELKLEPYKKLNIKTLEETKIPKKLNDALNLLSNTVSKSLTANAFPLILGGEHSITPAIVKSISKKTKSLTVVQIDAHADLRDGYLGIKNSHAAAMRRCLDNRNVKLVSFGIRNLCKEEFNYFKKNKSKINIFWANEMSKWKMSKLKKLIKNKNVYLTFDLDGFDSSLMPATGTPEPGGLFWKDAVKILKNVFKYSNVIGADINELAPNPSLHACDFLAAKLAYKMLAYKFSS